MYDMQILNILIEIQFEYKVKSDSFKNILTYQQFFFIFALFFKTK